MTHLRGSAGVTPGDRWRAAATHHPSSRRFVLAIADPGASLSSLRRRSAPAALPGRPSPSASRRPPRLPCSRLAAPTPLSHTLIVRPRLPPFPQPLVLLPPIPPPRCNRYQRHFRRRCHSHPARQLSPVAVLMTSAASSMTAPAEWLVAFHRPRSVRVLPQLPGSRTQRGAAGIAVRPAVIAARAAPAKVRATTAALRVGWRVRSRHHTCCLRRMGGRTAWGAHPCPRCPHPASAIHTRGNHVRSKTVAPVSVSNLKTRPIPRAVFTWGARAE